MALTRTADSWRLSETRLTLPWRAVAGLLARLRPRRSEIRLPRLSQEWLRQHEIDSLKHDDST